MSESPKYTYLSDAEVLARFIQDHIKAKHQVAATDPGTLKCNTCGAIAKVHGGRHASEVLYKNRPET